MRWEMATHLWELLAQPGKLGKLLGCEGFARDRAREASKPSPTPQKNAAVTLVASKPFEHDLNTQHHAAPLLLKGIQPTAMSYAAVVGYLGSNSRGLCCKMKASEKEVARSRLIFVGAHSFVVNQQRETLWISLPDR